MGDLPFFYWVIVGVLVIAGVARLITTVGKAAGTRGCPSCLGRVDRQAVKCRHCGEPLPVD